jgi:hypothetical protein
MEGHTVVSLYAITFLGLMNFSLVTKETKMTILPFFNVRNYKKRSLIQGFIIFIFETKVNATTNHTWARETANLVEIFQK